MKAVKAYYDGQAFVPLTPIKAAKNQQAIILSILKYDCALAAAARTKPLKTAPTG